MSLSLATPDPSMCDTAAAPKSHSLVACLICLVVWGGWFFSHIHSGYLAHLTCIDDAATYVDAARYCADGRGLIHNCAFNRLETELTMPLLWYPPGYPLLAVPLLRLGMSAWNAALLISALGGAVFAVLLGFACVRLLGLVAGVLVSALVLSMPALTLISTMPLSDAPFLALAAGALLALARAQRSPHPARWLLLAGLAGGGAYCIRYVGMALLAASAAYIGLHLLWKPFRKVVGEGLIWAGGAVAASGWLLYRNLIKYGKLSPYDLPPSERGLYQNILDVLNTVLADLTGASSPADEAISAGVLLVVAAALVAAMAVLLYRRIGWTNLRCWLREQSHLALLLLYVLSYVDVIVISRTTYLWDPVVEARYMVQIYWLVWIAGAWCVMACCQTFHLTGWRTKVVLAGVFLLLLGLQAAANIRSLLELRDSEPNMLTPVITDRFARLIPAHQVVMTDAHCAMRMFSRINARMFPIPDQEEIAVTLVDLQDSARDGLLWGIIITDPDPCGEGRYGAAIQQIVADPENVPGFEKLADENDLLVLKWVGIPDDDKPETAATRPTTRAVEK